MTSASAMQNTYNTFDKGVCCFHSTLLKSMLFHSVVVLTVIRSFELKIRTFKESQIFDLFQLIYFKFKITFVCFLYFLFPHLCNFLE